MTTQLKTIIFLAATSLTVLAQETMIHMARDKKLPPYYKLINSQGYTIKTNRCLGLYCIKYKPLVMYDNYYAEENIDYVRHKISKDLLKKTTSMSS